MNSVFASKIEKTRCHMINLIYLTHLPVVTIFTMKVFQIGMFVFDMHLPSCLCEAGHVTIWAPVVGDYKNNFELNGLCMNIYNDIPARSQMIWSSCSEI